ncbi:hypothetical protein, partial [Pseudomonas sp.]|uniref:hypothetical protein n=1 Tax=Pseudomonas sp. TaxID=306 RepID=UPI002586B8B1
VPHLDHLEIQVNAARGAAPCPLWSWAARRFPWAAWAVERLATAIRVAAREQRWVNVNSV